MADLRLKVLGAGPAWANPGGACSGYLVSAGDDNVLVECGFGILSRLRQALPLDRLRAVVISHLHADHFMDLVPLRYGLKYGRLRSDPALPLHAPPGASEFFARLGNALDGDEHFFDATYDLHEYSPELPLRLGALTFNFCRVKHYIPSYGMSIRLGVGGQESGVRESSNSDPRLPTPDPEPRKRLLAYSADAAPCPAVAELARGADLFLCEAAINGPQDDDPNPDNRGHMTALEAAQLARQAGAARLLLTHYRSDSNCEDVLRPARDAFGGPTEFVQEGQTYTV